MDIFERIGPTFRFPELRRIADHLQKLQKEGVLITHGQVKINDEVEKIYYLFFKNVIIAEGKTGAELKKAIAPFFGKNGVVLIDQLHIYSIANGVVKGIDAISKKIIESIKGKRTLQTSEDLDRLYQQAATAKKELEHITEEFAKLTNGTPGYRPKKNNGLKLRDRALEKIDAHYEGVASNLVDIAGSKVVYNTLEELYAALDKLQDHFDVVRLKDRITRPVKSGYRDILTNVRMSNGHIAEFRLHLKVIDDAAKIEHELYKKYRTYEAISRTRALSKNEKLGMKKIRDQQISVYQNASKILNLE